MIDNFQIVSKEKELDKQLLMLFILSLLLFIIPFFRSIAFVVFVSIIVYFLYRFDFMKTKKDFFRFMIYKIKLERELIDARFYVKLRSQKDGRIFVKLPKVEILQKTDFVIIVKISCSIENFERLGKLDLSPIFNGYRQMITSNDIERDKIIFELEKIDFDRQLKIKSIDEIEKINWRSDLIVIDRLTSVSAFAHLLLTGQTGSGKTYGLLYLLLCYRLRNADVSVCDPKLSDLADLSKKLGCRSVTSKDEILEEVRQTFLEMERRKQQRQQEGWAISSVATENGLSLKILMIDEFASLQLKLDKKELSELLNYLYQIILEGRALGVFVILGLQQANATVLPTALREQFSSIFVLGNSGEQTKNVAFQEKANKIPDFPLAIGEGWCLNSSEIDLRFIRFPHLLFLNELK
jgi:ftsK-like DNA segregation ATPase, YDCQ B.subtilis ortholog